MHLRRVALLLLISAIALGEAGQTLVDQAPQKISALDALRRAEPNAKWDDKSAVLADVTCDGNPDTIAVGYKRKKVFVGVVPGGVSEPASKPMVFEFSVGEHSQESFCETPVRIKTSPLTCRSWYGRLKGCKVVRGCREFAVIDDACDSFHFFWNSSENAFNWWRL